MTLEFALLAAGLLVLPIAGLTNIPFLILFAFAVIISFPVIRLIRQGAPPFLPTGKKVMRRMTDLANIKPGERVYDLGCGDGRFIAEAAKRGANATGYELSVPAYLLAKLRTMRLKNAHIVYADFWEKDYKDADVIFCFLLMGAMKKFHERIWPQLKPGTRVISHMFPMPGVEPEKREKDVIVYVKK